MNQQAIVVPAAVQQRANRTRRAKSVQDRLFELALQRWFEWLLAFQLPRNGRRVGTVGDELVDTWAAMVRSARSNTEHSDSVLGKLLADEAAGWAWPASVHSIIVEYPRTWQLALLGTAMGQTQATIAKAVGVDQSNVSRMLDLIKTRFLPALIMLGSTEQQCRRAFGCSTPPLRFA